MTIDKLRNTAYSADYAKLTATGVDHNMFFSVAQIRDVINKDSVVLDVGCGTAYRTLPLAEKCATFYGIDPSEPLLEKARESVKEKGLNNVNFSEGIAQNLNIPDSSIDVVISQLAPHDVKEAYRVLRPGGIFYLEKTGVGDKREMKELFGSDKNGSRGYLCEMNIGDRKDLIEQEFKDAGFTNTATAHLFFKGYLPKIEDVVLLMETVKITVRDFSREKDKQILEEIEKEFMTPEGIQMNRHEVVVYGYK